MSFLSDLRMGKNNCWIINMMKQAFFKPATISNKKHFKSTVASVSAGGADAGGKRAVYHILPLRPIIKLLKSNGGEDTECDGFTPRVTAGKF